MARLAGQLKWRATIGGYDGTAIEADGTPWMIRLLCQSGEYQELIVKWTAQRGFGVRGENFSGEAGSWNEAKAAAAALLPK